MVVGSGNPGAPVATPKPKLLQQVRDAIRRKHFSPRTEESYVHWIKRFVFFHGKRHKTIHVRAGEREGGRWTRTELT